MTTQDNLARASERFAAHLNRPGVFLLEPWFGPESWESGTLHALFVDEPGLKIARMNISETDGRLSVMEMHYLVGTPKGIEYFTEHHEMGLFTRKEYGEALSRTGLRVEYDEEGLMGRGLYIRVLD